MSMKRSIVGVMLGVLLLWGGLMGIAMAAEPKVIQTHKAKDVVVTLLSESGQLTKGKNAFVLQFTSAATNQPLDAGKVTLNTSMSMPGMAPMVADAALSADKTPGRYLGTIDFPDSGTRQVTVTWEGPAGKGSTRFSVPVR
jgi:YtkA-like